jgi:hypothetical protein
VSVKTEMDELWLSEHPALAEWMTMMQWSDGRPRETSTVLLFFDTGMWKACLNDRDAGRVAFVSGASPASVLGLLDTQLQESAVEWRSSRASLKKR